MICFLEQGTTWVEGQISHMELKYENPRNSLSLKYPGKGAGSDVVLSGRPIYCPLTLNRSPLRAVFRTCPGPRTRQVWCSIRSFVWRAITWKSRLWLLRTVWGSASKTSDTALCPSWVSGGSGDGWLIRLWLRRRSLQTCTHRYQWSRDTETSAKALTAPEWAQRRRVWKWL